MDWFSKKNADRRQYQLDIGHKYENIVASKLVELGFNVIKSHDVTPVKIDGLSHNYYPEDFDLLVNNKYFIEVKSRNFEFSPMPFKTIYIDGQKGYDLKTYKPFAVLFISQPTEEILVLPGLSKKYWWVEQVNDGLRGFKHLCYVTDTKHLRPFKELVNMMRNAV